MTVEYAAQLQSIFIQIRVAPGVERLRALSDIETFDYDMVEAVPSEAAKFSAFVLAPLNRVMDREGVDSRRAAWCCPGPRGGLAELLRRRVDRHRPCRGS